MSAAFSSILSQHGPPDTSKTPKIASQEASKTAQDVPKRLPGASKTSKIAAKKLPRPPNTSPRGLQMLQRRPRSPPDGSKTAKDVPKKPPDASKMAGNAPKMPPRPPKTNPRSLQDAQDLLQIFQIRLQAIFNHSEQSIPCKVHAKFRNMPEMSVRNNQVQ